MPVDLRLRASAVIGSVTELTGAVQVNLVTTIELEGVTEPAAVVESITRYLA